MGSNKDVVAIIQARIGSERFPRKVLMDIEGRPMFWHVVDRLKSCKLIDRTVVATTTREEDDLIEESCKRYKIDFYRGNDEDVLDRYYQAAKEYLAGVIVRVTADCPLIDPQVTDKVIAAYLENSDNFDGASNIIRRTYPRGLDTEVFPCPIIEKAWRESNKDYQKEHVTVYIYEHQDFFRLYSVENDEDLSNLRWTVDEHPDLEFVRQIYKRLYREGKIFFMKDVLRILKREPCLKDLNKDVRQKAILK